ncbi:MAG: HD domain-containing phosphohydrolase [Candidatus Aminicenantales bacterium]
MKPKIRLLIVEDEGLVARDIENMAERAGYEVCGVASTGEQALSLAATLRPDLALVDIILKGPADGIETAQKLWKEMDIPSIYVTAYADELTLLRAKETSPFGYIIKPFDERELRVNIEMALFKSQMELKLRERENWLATILRTIGDAVIATDAQNRITYLNPSAERLTGWKAAEALNRPLEQVLELIPFMEENRPLTYLRSKNKNLVSVEHSITPLKINPSLAPGELIVVRDISSRIQAEKEAAESWQKLERALEGTIQALALTIEIRDPYTAGHQRRVSQLAAAIAKRMGLTEDQVRAIRVAGDIHDIGKISIPAEILGRPARLNQVEFEIIKTHPQVGYDILKKVNFPWPVAQIVLQHHERIDGSGYPAGLRNDEILPEARIIAVADTVEAMASHRPYRPALGVEKALIEILRFKGILFDSDAVDACLYLFRKENFQWS